jgi:uncharacterized phiE125 gp8 family phage protein
VRHWRDIPQSFPVEITTGLSLAETAALGTVAEPVSLEDAKDHILTTLTDVDAWIESAIVAARMQAETDTNRKITRAVLEMTFDQFPIEPWIPLPLAPLISVTSISSFDTLTNAETVFDSSNYVVDTFSQPGRVCLLTGKIWPVGVRWLQGGKIRWIAGYADGLVPARYLHAIKLLIGNWSENRESSGVMRGTPDVYPLGYESLVGDRISFMG